MYTTTGGTISDTSYFKRLIRHAILSSRPMGDYFVGFEQTGHVGRDADRRWKIPLLSAPLRLSEGNYLGDHTSHLTDEGSSVGLEGKGNPLRLHQFQSGRDRKPTGFSRT